MRFLDPSGRSCPAAFSATTDHRDNSDNNNNVIEGKLENEARLIELAAGCDVVTMEIEHVGVAELKTLEERGVAVRTSSEVVTVAHENYCQKVRTFARQLIKRTTKLNRRVDTVLTLFGCSCAVAGALRVARRSAWPLCAMSNSGVNSQRCCGPGHASHAQELRRRLR